MHSNVTIKNVSWPHFSWATLYSAIKFEDSEALAIDLQVIHIHTGFIELWLLARLHEFGYCHNMFSVIVCLSVVCDMGVL